MHAERLVDHNRVEIEIPRYLQGARPFVLIQEDFNPDDPDETRPVAYGWQQIGGAFCSFVDEQDEMRATVHSDSADNIADRYHDGVPTRVQWIEFKEPAEVSPLST